MLYYKGGLTMKIKIILIKSIHYIEGDEYSLFVENPELPIEVINSIPVIPLTKEPISMRKVNSLAKSLRNLGAEVEIEKRVDKDPNFESYDAAMEYLDNRGY